MNKAVKIGNFIVKCALVLSFLVLLGKSIVTLASKETGTTSFKSQFDLKQNYPSLLICPKLYSLNKSDWVLVGRNKFSDILNLPSIKDKVHITLIEHNRTSDQE